MRTFLLDMQTKQDILLQQKLFATFCCNHLNSFDLVFLFFLKFLIKQTRLMKCNLFIQEIYLCLKCLVQSINSE